MAKLRAFSTSNISMPGARKRPSTTAMTNRFALLDPAESLEPPPKPIRDTVSFLSLSPELRQDVYDLIVGGHTDTCGTRLMVRKHQDDHRPLNPRKFKVRSSYALLYVNRQVGYEFFATLERSVPFHISLLLEMTVENQQPVINCSHLAESLPMFAESLVLDMSYLAEVGDDRIYDADHQMYTVSSPTFLDLASLLLECSNLTNIVLCWLPSAFTAHHIDQWQDVPKDIIFDSMVQVIESLPRLLRYAVSTGDSGMYASRHAADIAWHDTRVVRFTQEMLPEPEGEWADLLRELTAHAVVPRLPET
ncbi:hypothetical protein LTR85_009311 [Meristemomyces frigidus]|nr:hypothetical protein LTR85_009311 [Meristemomyces frigidus]